MNVEKINKKAHKGRILVAPLNWGLGHATRCIPIIRLLIEHGAEVIIAGENPVASLLQKEFPGLPILQLKGYKISYSNSKSLFFLKMLAQLPKVISATRYEKSWLDHIIIEHKIDAVISDNRFGFYSNKVPCVFITHQLFIQTGNKFLNKPAQKINYKYINKFGECWVPDSEGVNNLAGKLSHPEKLPEIPVKYLGILSRWEKKEVKKEINLLVMISGPEPQRSIFENILLRELKGIEGTIIILRGLPGEQTQLIPGNEKLSIFNHLPTAELDELVQRSKLVVARCGYSTIMDLAALKQKAILIPTPGQTEQEYLARYLKEKKIFFTISQENFSLKQQMEDIKHFEFAPMNIPATMNEKIILDWLEKINLTKE